MDQLSFWLNSPGSPLHVVSVTGFTKHDIQHDDMLNIPILVFTDNTINQVFNLTPILPEIHCMKIKKMPIITSGVLRRKRVGNISPTRPNWLCIFVGAAILYVSVLITSGISPSWNDSLFCRSGWQFLNFFYSFKIFNF